MPLRIALDLLGFDLERLTYAAISGLVSRISSHDAGYVLRQLYEIAVPVLAVLAFVLLALLVLGAFRGRGPA